MHPGPSRRSRTTQAPSALSQGEYACGGTPLAICAAAMASRRTHIALPRPASPMQKGKDGSLVQRELSANAD